MNNLTATNVDLFESILNIVRADATGSQKYRQFEMESLNNYCREGMETDSKKFLATLFINALSKRFFSSTKVENIYEKKYDVSQIQLFDILINKFPFVKYSQQIINDAIINEIRNHTEVTLIDIGIGLGTQMVNILECAKSINTLKKITLVGIEPFHDALAQAITKFSDLKRDLPFELNFIPVEEYIENVDFTAISGLSKHIVVNASLALHHIQTNEQRNKVMAEIRKINPVAFFMIEPNVDHFEPILEKRFYNCYYHFYSLFKLIDTLDISRDEKSALKLFFGREIEDILGKNEEDRFEKHEPATKFITRLIKNKFSINSGALNIPVANVAGVQIKHHSEGYVGFTYQNETVLSLIAAY